ncbi:MAG TPA: diacylglycerol kinase family protein [bacterium]|nr:diacylglycerol kinase family protein [bacterium]
MTAPWSHLGVLRPALITPIQPNTQWIAVVNPQAGNFEAVDIASAVQHEVGSRMTIYETDPDPDQRLREITALVAEKEPSLRNPLGVIALGGDRTGSDAVMGVLRYAFPRLHDLWEGAPELVYERMLQSGIQVGILPLGGANDNGSIYGAPKIRASDKSAAKKALKFMDEALVTTLNLGVAFLGEERIPQVFCHSLSAGETIAPVYESTVEERGRKAKRHRERLFLGNAWAQRSFHALWNAPGGAGTSQEILEVLFHSVVRADEKMGLPGTPRPGLGVKIFPAKGRWNTVKMFQEVLWAGIKSRNGNPAGLGPEDRLKSFSETNQPRLQVGEEMEFTFRSDDGSPFAAAVQSEGDFVDRASVLRVRALPPFPRMMVADGSLAANLRKK